MSGRSSTGEADPDTTELSTAQENTAREKRLAQRALSRTQETIQQSGLTLLKLSNLTLLHADHLREEDDMMRGFNGTIRMVTQALEGAHIQLQIQEELNTGRERETSIESTRDRVQGILNLSRTAEIDAERMFRLLQTSALTMAGVANRAFTAAEQAHEDVKELLIETSRDAQEASDEATQAVAAAQAYLETVQAAVLTAEDDLRELPDSVCTDPTKLSRLENISLLESYAILAEDTIAFGASALTIGDIGILTENGTITGLGTGPPYQMLGGNTLGYNPEIVDGLTTALSLSMNEAELYSIDSTGDGSNYTETTIGGANLGGLLTPLLAGIHTFDTSGSTLNITNDIILKGSGYGSCEGPTDVFLLVVQGNLDITANQSVLAIDGTRTENIFWYVTGTVMVGAGSTLTGIVLAKAAVTIGAGGTVNGRIFTQTTCGIGAGARITPPGETRAFSELVRTIGDQQQIIVEHARSISRDAQTAVVSAQQVATTAAQEATDASDALKTATVRWQVVTDLQSIVEVEHTDLRAAELAGRLELLRQRAQDADMAARIATEQAVALESENTRLMVTQERLRLAEQGRIDAEAQVVVIKAAASLEATVASAVAQATATLSRVSTEAQIATTLASSIATTQAAITAARSVDATATTDLEARVAAAEARATVAETRATVAEDRISRLVASNVPDGHGVRGASYMARLGTSSNRVRTINSMLAASMDALDRRDTRTQPGDSGYRRKYPREYIPMC